MLGGADITGRPAYARNGIGLVPEGRRIFPDLTVEENLIVGAARVSGAELARGRDMAFATFPRLKDRRRQLAGSLSGGEQQMLAMSRALMASPSVLLVDELSLGLMPTAIDECYRVLRDLRDDGMAILLVEQSTERVAAAADRLAIMESGQITWTGTGDDAASDGAILRAYLGVG